jgi:hypothetical protein
MLVDIENEKGKLVRDTDSMALLNVDVSALNRDMMYKNKLKKEQELQGVINNLQSEVSSLKSDISKILELLNSRGS